MENIYKKMLTVSGGGGSKPVTLFYELERSAGRLQRLEGAYYLSHSFADT